MTDNETDNKIDLSKYQRKKRTFNGSNRDLRTTCEIIADKPTAIEYFISFIHNNEKVNDVKRILEEDVPDYFWVNPSSSSGRYHPSDERSKYGLVLHTARVVKITNDLCIAAQIIDSDRDDLIISAILHDSFKYGFPGGYHTVKNHSNIPQEHIHIHDRIIELIRTHDGQWSVNPSEWDNADDSQRILHYADYISSRSYVHIRIP